MIAGSSAATCIIVVIPIVAVQCGGSPWVAARPLVHRGAEEPTIWLGIMDSDSDAQPTGAVAVLLEHLI